MTSTSTIIKVLGKGDNGLRTLQEVSNFLIQQLDQQKLLKPNDNSPLFVGIQGPQGCGKSHLCTHLPPYLASLPKPLNVVTLGLDDLYSNHSSLKALHESNLNNKLWKGRGQPGTHDLKLAKECLNKLKQINLKESMTGVNLPIFDKSLFEGEGDRSEEVVSIPSGTRVDLVILEGWMCGFPSLSSQTLTELYSTALQNPEEMAKQWGYEKPFLLEHDLEHLLTINESLKEYEVPVWDQLDCFVQLSPVEIGYTWNWRLQQEHAMKAKNGGKGMTDEQVKDFIGRYMPGYELFLTGIQSDTRNWYGRGLKITVGREREVLETSTF